MRRSLHGCDKFESFPVLPCNSVRITDAVSFTHRESPNTKAFLISWHVVIGKGGKSALFSLVNEDTTQTDHPPWKCLIKGESEFTRFPDRRES